MIQTDHCDWENFGCLLLILDGLPAEHMVQKHLSIRQDGGSPQKTAQQSYSTARFIQVW